MDRPDDIARLEERLRRYWHGGAPRCDTWRERARIREDAAAHPERYVTVTIDLAAAPCAWIGPPKESV